MHLQYWGGIYIALPVHLNQLKIVFAVSLWVSELQKAKCISVASREFALGKMAHKSKIL